MRQTNKLKTPIVLRVALVLLFAMLITSYMMGGIYARYSTTVTGTASASVAKFDVDAHCVYDAVIDKYVLTITNNSEVTVSYSVLFMVDGAELPNGVAITEINNQILALGNSATHIISVTENYAEQHTELLVDMVVTVEQVD